MKAIVVGAGIGGLAAALALLRRDWTVEVLERAPELTEVGAGIQVSPNGMKALTALGLAETVEARSYEPQALEMRIGRSGRRLFRLKQGQRMRARYGAPYLQVHRADLLAILSQAVSAAGGAIRTSVEVEDYMGAAAISGGETVAKGDLLIGADGLRSAIRAAMLEPAPPRFTGVVAWRALAPAEALSAFDMPAGACAWVGDGRHCVTYPLRGGDLVNFVGLVERNEPEGESWTIEGDREDALADFAGWATPLRTILETAETVHRWPLYDRPPLRRWTEGPVALLGDACHPMLPSFAQGACMALEDAWRLGVEVGDGSGDIPTALKRYELARRDRATQVQQGARANMNRFHKRDWLTATFGFLPIWAAGRVAPWLIENHTAWVYGYDETAA
ncbi:MAG: FAD-dependent monooxygenase [Pseudomonadota bacterium]